MSNVANNPLFGRIVAVVGSGITSFILNLFGIPLTDTEMVAEVGSIVNDGVNLLGIAVFTGLYAVYHKTYNRFFAPSDAAVPEKDLAIKQRLHALKE